MNKESDSSSDISLDSLEVDQKKKSSSKSEKSVENVDTILVPFYEKDVLIKVPRGNNQPIKVRKCNDKNDKSKKQIHQSRNYLVNKDPEKKQKSSYLEMFRKQFRSSFSATHKKDTNEIRSISPEFGDTERESIENETINNPETEFYNTESYNEIYYEKLMNRELKQYFDDFMEDELQLNGDRRNKTPENTNNNNNNNLKSVSEVSHPHRQTRRVSVPPIQNVRLGGLGPDTENIKPRLQRARSLQRYSEKVRMENRLRIYKKTIEDENKIKIERAASVKKQETQSRSKEQKENKTNSYLFNSVPEKSSMMKRIYSSKSKSADVQRVKDREKVVREKKIDKNNSNIVREEPKRNSTTEGRQSAKIRINSNEGNTTRIKSSARTKGNKREENEKTAEITPVHISFLVNVGGVRPSSALKTLEAQHRVYQEKVKAFMEFNKD